MKQNYRISVKAIEDLEKIWFYTLKNWSEAQANRYYSLIISEIEFLVSNFDSGKDMSFIKPGYKKTVVKSHFIFYRKGEDGILEVIRILHQSMDVENKFK